MCVSTAYFAVYFLGIYKMAWLSQIAERAEALFENLDQATASSMEKAGIATPRKTPSDHRERREAEQESTLSFTSGSSLGPSQPVRGGREAKLTTPTQAKPTTPTQVKPTTPTQDTSLPLKSPSASAKEYDDESLFEFLNTPSKQPQSGTKRGSSRSSSTAGRGRSSKLSGKGTGGLAGTAGQLKAQSTPSGRVAGVKAVEDAGQMVVASSGASQGDEEDGVVGGTSDTPLEAPLGKTVQDASWMSSPEAMQRSPDTSHDTSHDLSCDTSHDTPHGVPHDKLPAEDLQVTTLKVQVSSLELENKLLRREVASLNEEGRESAARVRNLQDSNAAFQQEAMKGREKVMSLEAELAHHTHQLNDAQAALESQTSQVQALQSRLSSMEKELVSAKRDCAQALTEKERLMRDATDVNGAHTTAVTSLRQQLAAAEQAVVEEEASASRMQETLTARQVELEAELREIKAQLSTANSAMAEGTLREGELVASLAAAEEQLGSLRQEHTDYRHKAASILQAKDREIAVLESGGGEAIQEQLQQATLQQAVLEEEAGRQREAARELQGELKTIVEQSEVEIGRLEACLAVAEEGLSEEKKCHAETQSELARVRVDLEASRRELLQHTSTLNAQLQERDVRLAELEGQVALTSAPSTATEGAELEGRLQELTESLIQRQTLVETLTGEKHSLAIQLEEMKRQQREGAGQGEGQQSSHSVVVSGLEVETAPSSQMRSMSSALPSVLQPGRSRWSRKVHNAVNTLDSFSVRFGVFLRRHPHARLFLVVYGALLHLWVMVVLVTYSPEVHLDPPTNSPTQ